MRAVSTKILKGGRGALALPAAALLLVFFATGARAQSEQQDAPQDSRPEWGARRQGRRAGDSLMRRLNLTPEQRARLREIRGQREPAARELTRRVRLARRALDDAIYSDAVDEALVEQRARALADAQAALVRLRAETELKVRRVLTPEQLQSFRELRREAQRRRASEARPEN